MTKRLQILAINKEVGGLGECVKKGKFARKIFLKSCKKMIYADIKTDAKQEIKELVAVSHNFSQKYLLKT